MGAVTYESQFGTDAQLVTGSQPYKLYYALVLFGMWPLVNKPRKHWG